MQVLKTKKTRLTPLCLLLAQVGNETERKNTKVRYEERSRAMRKKEEMKSPTCLVTKQYKHERTSVRLRALCMYLAVELIVRPSVFKQQKKYVV